ncbi:prostate and testis expressed protein 4 precursor [Mus musculus]|uniref:Prostate and testis expressed protein 4 n=1 Tax=Mus musculus TaxID=10090 RepID=PATE4_MOUSE|nr:prostate and testis expressed protein 4 precursor [Mus musculus]Q09098.3 RecName: Full=Prostate and testis expressed protein 4; AltName: Full=Calcium transport inhibitor; AltName: Full=Caltrin; AltName: Full=PATE-like protein B; Short=PATE-B; AltName: Full=Seminal vesicle protein 7; AltName: Full=Seminal vesicle protein VII; Short=SVS VII; Flags: Precursor [Mus musculus]AAI20765.1 Prostate and testis expressed 4 [Mus musculus]AAI20767.1 Prostate and testis expressed 4 [Mus musculus]EDL25400.|eukprot:NP_064660.2 prostate and testis expressed protein 4 precursor [Mus musculus]
MNSVTKISTLLIVILSFLCFVEGLICNSCEKSRDSRCTMSQSRCVAKPGESCSTVSHFVGTKHVYSKQMCSPQCKEKQLNTGKKLIYIMCCEKNLCNSF